MNRIGMLRAVLDHIDTAVHLCKQADVKFVHYGPLTDAAIRIQGLLNQACMFAYEYYPIGESAPRVTSEQLQEIVYGAVAVTEPTVGTCCNCGRSAPLVQGLGLCRDCEYTDGGGGC